MTLPSDLPSHPCSFSSKQRSGSARTPVKIAYIGGGSRQWAIHLMKDLALSNHLTGHLDLYDLDFEAAKFNENLAKDLFNHPTARAKFTVTAQRELSAALKGADFVVISIEPGPTTLRHADLEIPARYGITQTVGDTTGPGGLMRALRSIPIYKFFAHAIMEHCPQTWVINYTNPMAVCTATLYAVEPQIKAIGCCHEVFGTQKMLAELIEKQFKVPRPERQEISLDISGVNHFTWAIRATWDGKDLFPIIRQAISAPDFFKDRSSDALASQAKEQWFDHCGLVAYDLFRRFGALGAAGDRHLAEFVPWYLSTENELHRWGVLTTPYAWRLRRSIKPRDVNFAPKGMLEPSGEEGVAQMEALVGHQDMVTNINIPNRGQVREVADGIIVETNALISRDKIQPLCAPELPPGAAEMVHRAATEQSLTLRAGLECDFHLALKALMLHPLVRLPLDSATQMLNEMIMETSEFLPDWPQQNQSAKPATNGRVSIEPLEYALKG